MSKSLVDFHCHLDLYPNFLEIVAECERREIYTLAVTTTPRAWQKNSALTMPTKYVRAALGLHPQVVGEFYYEVDALCDLIPETRYVGEVGLDGSTEHAASFDLQKSVLDKILLTCSANGGRIISLHSRRATSEVLDMLEKHKKSGIPILHWFSGSLKELERAISLGCWFSVGPAMLNSKRGQELASKIPLDRLLTETDGPFTGRKGNPYMPWNVVIVLEKLGSIWKLEPIKVQNQILQNTKKLCTQ